jgi:TatD DNase family protein
MLQFTDTHSHLYDTDFSDDIEQVVQRSVQNGVIRSIMPSVDKSTYRAMMDTAQSYKEFAFPAIGLHPTSVKEDWRDELDFVLEKAHSELFIAVGEIGIDGYWSKDFMNEQIEVFEEQLRLASECNLPVIIHSREATNEIFDTLERCKALNLRGVFHAFSGSYETACRIFSYGDFFLGIGGVVTFKNSKLPGVIEKIGIEKLVLETDSPWLSPVPYRGKRNEPSYIPLIAGRIAEIKGCSIESIASETTANSQKLFNTGIFF